MLNAFELQNAIKFAQHQENKTYQMQKTFLLDRLCDYLQEKTQVIWERRDITDTHSCLVSALFSKTQADKIAENLPQEFFFNTGAVKESSTKQGFRVVVNPDQVKLAMEAENKKKLTK
jgi:hypothetical protein